MLASELVESCPFWSKEEQKLKCPVRMLRDLILIWTPPVPEKVGMIYLPDVVRENVKKKLYIGVVLSVGPGYDNGKRFYPSFVKPGWVVYYDPNTPWQMKVRHTDGNDYELRYMGEQDVKLLVEADQEVDQISDLVLKGRYR